MKIGLFAATPSRSLLVAPAANWLISDARDLVDEENVALLRQIRTALKRRRHKASIGALEGVVGAVLAFAHQDPVGENGCRRRLSGAGGNENLKHGVALARSTPAGWQFEPNGQCGHRVSETVNRPVSLKRALGQGSKNLLWFGSVTAVPTLEPSYPARAPILPGIPVLPLRVISMVAAVRPGLLLELPVPHAGDWRLSALLLALRPAGRALGSQPRGGRLGGSL
jgi:hypothetical protein